MLLYDNLSPSLGILHAQIGELFLLGYSAVVKMTKIRQFLWILAAVIFSVVMMHLLFIRKYNVRDAAIHIVQSLQIDLNKEKHSEEALVIDPHGHLHNAPSKVEEVLPEVIKNSPKATITKSFPENSKKDEAQSAGEAKPEVKVETTKELAVAKDVSKQEVAKNEDKNAATNNKDNHCDTKKNLGLSSIFLFR